MKVLVTGSAGLIGRWVVERLETEGNTVIGLDCREAAEARWTASHRRCDILDGARLTEIFQAEAPDALVHLAARVGLEETRDIAGYAANTDGVRNVLAAVAVTPSIRRAVYTSSQMVCRTGYVPRGDRDYCPHTLYGQSKVLTEKIVCEADGAGREWCLGRPTTVWGPHMNPHYQQMLGLVRDGRYFHVGRRPLHKSYAYAGNIAWQYARLLDAPANKIHRRTFYLADYQPISLRDYVDGLARTFGARPVQSFPEPLVRLLARIGDALNAVGWARFPFNSFRLTNILTEYVFDMTPTREVCGELPYTFEEGLAATARWFMELSPERHAAHRVYDEKR
jgi:nucleoside-diphosphate-sugar epimerase